MELTYEQILSEIENTFDSETIEELCIDLAPIISNYSGNLGVAVVHLEELKKDERLNEQDKNNLDMVLNTLRILKLRSLRIGL